MSVAEQIVQHVKALPEVVQVEVLDFVEYLESKTEIRKHEDAGWSNFSLTHAMRGMELEASPYSADALKELFT